jgi:hypothetical protein
MAIVGAGLWVLIGPYLINFQACGSPSGGVSVW